MPIKSLLSLPVMIGHILALYRYGANRYGYAQMQEWSQWYGAYRTMIKDLAIEYDVPFENVAAAFAWFSPRTQLARNVQLTIDLLNNYSNADSDLSNIGCPKQFKDKAWTCLNGDMSSLELTDSTKSRKVRTFYRNLIGDESIATIDAHAVGIAMGAGTDLSVTYVNPDGQAYKIVESAYIAAAKILNVTPCQLQAVTWCIRRAGMH